MSQWKKNQKEKDFNPFTLNYNLDLLYKSKFIENWRQRCSVVGKLRRTLKNNFRICSERIMFKCRYDDSIRMKEIRKILETLVLNLPFTRFVKDSMLKEARFVQTSRKKLSDLFFNHIKVAKLFAKGKKPICV